MAVGGNEPTRKRKRTRTRTNKREDRLSSLPDDILIKILSCLPLRLAMATGCLSWRWRGLWTYVTSIHIDSNEFDYSRDLDITLNDIITRFSSPSIHSFSVELGDIKDDPKPNLNYSWLRQICDRNVRELKLTKTRNVRELKSLVSIELDSMFNLRLPDDGDPINLPNLKKLHLCSASMNVESLEKLIKACPSLEEFGFVNMFSLIPLFSRIMGRNGLTPLCYIKFSHQNLQRLFIKNLPSNYRVVLSTPKLEYFAIRCSKSVAFRFEEEPMMSCAAEIDITDDTDYNCALTEDEIMSMTKFYGIFCIVTILTPKVFVLQNSWPSNMFCNATRLTLSMNMPSNINILLAILGLCPVLGVLTLQIWDTDRVEWVAEMPVQVSTLQRVLEKIKIEINCNTNGKTTKSFVELVEYLLSKSVDLKQFHMKVNWSYYKRGSTTAAQIREMKLCMLPYHCQIVSAGCEVEFVGRFFKMSRKAGLKIMITNGNDIPIN